MTNSTQFLVDITNFIVNNFKNHKIWDVEIAFPESSEDSANGFPKYGLVEVSATDFKGNWNSHSFMFNSPENVDEETKSYFTNCTFPLYVNTSNTVLWEE
jgi:hypothetical protein